MSAHLRRRLVALERDRHLHPRDLEEWTDVELEAAARALPLGPVLDALHDEELEAVANAPENTPLRVLLTDRPVITEWPEYATWPPLVQVAARNAWGMP